MGNTLAEIINDKNKAYWERDQFVVFLSKIYPSHLCYDPRESKEWQTIICIHAPVGQMTWHINGSEIEHFLHLEEQPYHYDGHSTEEKYKRLSYLGDLWTKRETMPMKKKKLILYKMQRGKCAYPECDITDIDDLTIDHKMPKAVAQILGWNKDQQDAIENLQLMCRPHHEVKDAPTPELRKKAMEKYDVPK